MSKAFYAPPLVLLEAWTGLWVVALPLILHTWSHNLSKFRHTPERENISIVKATPMAILSNPHGPNRGKMRDLDQPFPPLVPQAHEQLIVWVSPHIEWILYDFKVSFMSPKMRASLSSSPNVQPKKNLPKRFGWEKFDHVQPLPSIFTAIEA